MQKDIANLSGALTSTVDPPKLTVVLTPTNHPALKCDASSQSVLVQKIDVQCDCSGVYVPGTSTFVGSGTGSIVASTPRVQCEGQSVLTEGDSVTITFNGTVTTTASGATSTGPATVKVTLSDAGQHRVDANKS